MPNYFQNILESLRMASAKPDATEAELDQFAAELPSAESLAAAANEAAETKYADKIQTQADQITSLEAQLSDPERTSLVESLTERVQSLESEKETLASQIKTKEIQVSALSKDLAASKALYRPKDQPADKTILQPGEASDVKQVGDMTVTRSERGTVISGDVWNEIAAKVKK